MMEKETLQSSFSGLKVINEQAVKMREAEMFKQKKWMFDTFVCIRNYNLLGLSVTCSGFLPQ